MKVHVGIFIAGFLGVMMGFMLGRDSLQTVTPPQQPQYHVEITVDNGATFTNVVPLVRVESPRQGIELR